ncbi:MAG: LamG domain-containing protein, partial [Candidatus Nanoarchaeia archaeon]
MVINRGGVLIIVVLSLLIFVNAGFYDDIFLAPSGNLIAHYSFDDGTATDNSGNGNDGTVFGPVLIKGINGSGLNFDGVDDYILISNSPELTLTQDFTFSIWVKPDEFTNDVILCKGPNAGDPDYLLTLGFGFKDIGFYDGTSWKNSNQGILSQYMWNHVAFVYDGVEYKFYVNGVLKGLTSATGNIQTSSSDLMIGQQCLTGANNFNGVMDEVKIYNRALTEGEIQILSGVECVVDTDCLSDVGPLQCGGTNNDQICNFITSYNCVDSKCVAGAGALSCNQQACEFGCFDGVCLPQPELPPCVPQFDCSISPLNCPSSGIQTKTCVDSVCGMPDTTEEISCVPGVECSGCESNGKCIPYGTRLEQLGNSVYCDIDAGIINQKNDSVSCQNNYECLSNQCSNGVCVDIVGKVEESGRNIQQEVVSIKQDIQKEAGFMKKVGCRILSIISLGVYDYNECIGISSSELQNKLSVVSCSTDPNSACLKINSPISPGIDSGEISLGAGTKPAPDALRDVPMTAFGTWEIFPIRGERIKDIGNHFGDETSEVSVLYTYNDGSGEAPALSIVDLNARKIIATVKSPIFQRKSDTDFVKGPNGKFYPFLAPSLGDNPNDANSWGYMCLFSPNFTSNGACGEHFITIDTFPQTLYHSQSDGRPTFPYQFPGAYLEDLNQDGWDDINLLYMGGIYTLSGKDGSVLDTFIFNVAKFDEPNVNPPYFHGGRTYGSFSSYTSQDNKFKTVILAGVPVGEFNDFICNTGSFISLIESNLNQPFPRSLVWSKYLAFQTNIYQFLDPLLVDNPPVERLGDSVDNCIHRASDGRVSSDSGNLVVYNVFETDVLVDTCVQEKYLVDLVLAGYNMGITLD